MTVISPIFLLIQKTELHLVDPNEVFENFVAACGRNYADQAEEERRRDIFQRNVAIIRQVAAVKIIDNSEPYFTPGKRGL